jgi:SOS-response transcriptional repressor LexA
MPHALTDRQQEYLDFLREYIRENETSPRLDELAEHFHVTSPTAHKMLKALQSKGYIYFNRDSVSGFFIRLLERAGTTEQLIDVAITGKVDRYGEIHEFPQKHGHLPVLARGAEPDEVFALQVYQAIPEASILPNDILICDLSKRPQPTDIAVLPLSMDGKKMILCKIHSLTLDGEMPNLEVSNPYPIPEDLVEEEYKQKLHWWPLSYSEETEDYLLDRTEEGSIPIGPIPPDLVVATVLRLIRNLSF